MRDDGRQTLGGHGTLPLQLFVYFSLKKYANKSYINDSQADVRKTPLSTVTPGKWLWNPLEVTRRKDTSTRPFESP